MSKSTASSLTRRQHATLQALLSGSLLLLVAAAVGRVFAVAPGPAGLYPFNIVAACTFTVLGGLVVPRQPRNPVAWLFVGIGLANALVVVTASFSGFTPLLWANQWSPALAYGLIPLPLLLFPDGRLPSRRWRPVAWAAVAAVIVAVTGIGVAAYDVPQVLVDVDVPLPDRAQRAMWAAGVGLAGVVLATVAAVGSLLVRWRRAHGDTRQQLKWLAAGAAFIPVSIVLEIGGVPAAWAVAGAAVPSAAAVAVLKYRLYGIDRIISRTVSYALLTVLLGGLYVVVVTALSELLPIPRDSDVAVAASTLAVAAAFRPARRRIQTAVDRRFNRERYDAQRTVDRFVARLRDEIALEQLNADLLGTVHGTLQPTAASVWLRPRDARDPEGHRETAPSPQSRGRAEGIGVQ